MIFGTIPYNRVETTGNILFATRGGTIHSFNLSENKHVSSWRHPDAVNFASLAGFETESKSVTGETASCHEDEAINTPGNEPPAKRQRIASEDSGTALAVGAQEPPAEATTKVESGIMTGKKPKRGPSHGEKSRMGRMIDRPLVTLMSCTQDGKHLVAVSGHDKAVWVFEHDGHGHLVQLSQRIMPKRPSDIAIGFGPHIIVADKFGDVYCLPLFMTPLSPSALALRTAAPHVKPSEPAANTLTVHSKRNRVALEAQRKQLQAKASQGAEPKAKGPSFELSLLLGHVSMLTSLALVESQGRRYILTADRDEHIRVSRYKPHAHVIEGFCLGHKEFVSELLVPQHREDILISGGGDDDLFIWNWKTGTVLSRTNLLALSREVAPETAKVSVLCLTSLQYPAEESCLTYILALCEDVKAIFAWQLNEQDELKNPSIIQLPYNPLHIATVRQSNDEPVKIIVAMDTSATSGIPGLHEYTLTRSENRLSSDTGLVLSGQSFDDSDMQVPLDDVRDMLYAVSKLRKQGGSDAIDFGPVVQEIAKVQDDLVRD